jgi:hypothetical protein
LEGGVVAHYFATIDSRRSVNDVFSYLSDFSNCRAWDPSVSEAERLDEGPIVVGSSFHVSATFLGGTVHLRYVVVELEPDSRVVLAASLKRLLSIDEITVTSNGDKTTVTYHSELRCAGISRVLNPLLGFFFSKLADRAREGLERELNQ